MNTSWVYPALALVLTAPTKTLFSALPLLFAITQWNNPRLKGQLFHIYLITYGPFLREILKPRG